MYIIILLPTKEKENSCVLLVNNLHIDVKRYLLFIKNKKKIESNVFNTTLYNNEKVAPYN